MIFRALIFALYKQNRHKFKMSATFPHQITQTFESVHESEESCQKYKRISSVSSNSQFNHTRKIRQIHPHITFQSKQTFLKQINGNANVSSYIMKQQKNNINSVHIQNVLKYRKQGKAESIKMKYNNLLPQFLKIVYNSSHQILIDIVCQIQKQLQIQSFCQKVNKVLFNDIKMHMKNQNKHITLHHLKQIYFLAEKLYIFYRNIHQNIEIAVQGEYFTYARRKNLFKQTIYIYLKRKNDIQNNKSLGYAIIPQKQIIWNTYLYEPTSHNKYYCSNVQNYNKELQIFSSSQKSQTQKFINRLLQDVRKRQVMHNQFNIMEIQSQLQQNFYNQLLLETFLVFSTKNINNIYEVTLIQILEGRLKKYNIIQIKRGLKELSNRLKYKNINFLEYLQFHGSTIIQINKTKFNQANKCCLF